MTKVKKLRLEVQKIVFIIDYINILLEKGNKNVYEDLSKSSFNFNKFTAYFLEIKSTLKKILELENSFLSKCNSEYNVLKKAGNSIGFKHSELTKQKLKDNYSEQRKVFIKNLNLGKQFSEKTKKLMSISALK
jgi:hypothetical protein